MEQTRIINYKQNTIIMTNNKPKYTTVSIPIYLYKKTEKRISNKGFPSVSSFVAYLLREIEASKKADFSQDDKKKIISKLKNLGYFD